MTELGFVHPSPHFGGGYHRQALCAAVRRIRSSAGAGAGGVLRGRRRGLRAKREEEPAAYLRLQVLREVAASINQRESIERWGQARIEYYGLDEGNARVVALARPGIRGQWAVIRLPPPR
jgi:hypothetical protein